MNKRIKFIVVATAFFALLIATAGVVIVAMWEENYLKAIFFLLLWGLYSGVAKALRAYGKSILREERKMNDGHNGEA